MSELSARQRVLRTIEHQEADRVPAGLFGTHPPYEQRLSEHIGTSSVEDMYRALGIDVWHCRTRLTDTVEARELNGQPVDRWGIPVQLSREVGYGHESGAPLAEVSSLDEVEAHPWPAASDFVAEGLAEEIKAHDDFAIVGGIGSPIFHEFSFVCGFENSLILLSTEPRVAKAIIRRITDFWLGYLRKVLEAGQGRIDIIQNCNDFGTQRSLFISPEQFREFFKPELQRLYDLTKSYGAKVMQHSCGAIAPLIPDFIEMGADILNPIQVSASGMDIAALAANYGKQTCFYGGIDTQHVLPEGPPERIEEDTRELLRLFGDGGLILSGSQGLMDDISADHALAMLRAGGRLSQETL